MSAPILILATPAAGLSAGFNAPISGVFFAVETLLLTEKDYDSRGDSTPGLTIAMVLLASVLAATASQAGLGSTPSVRVPDYELVTPLELPLILVFGACCGLVSASCTYSNKVRLHPVACQLDAQQQGHVTLAFGGCHERPSLCQLRCPSQPL